MIYKLKGKIKLKTIICLIPAIVFLVFIFYMMIRTFTGTVKSTVTDTEISFDGFTALSDNFEDVLQENFYDRNTYINLDGLMTRVLGINSLNERQKLANGYLSDFKDYKDTASAATNIIGLNEFCQDNGITFLYLLAPSTSSIYDAVFAPGYSSNAGQNITSMIESITDAGVSAIDMNAWFEENGWSTEDVFFKTDHHWLPQTGLTAAKITMQYLEEQSVAFFDSQLFDEDNWTITTYKNWFLGSSGKRTGSLYAGTDDLAVYIPNFSTHYTYSYLDRSTAVWTYTNTILDLSYLDSPNYFDDNPYCVYMFNDYPIQITKNADATNSKRILIMGDSYKILYEYFLSTQFQEMYTIDLRYYTDGTLIQYIEDIQPDILLMCTTEGQLSVSSLYDFGLEDYYNSLQAEENGSEVIEIGNVELTAQENNSNNFTVLYTGLEPGQTYTLQLDSVSYSGGNDLFAQMTLQNLSTNTAIYNRYFDVNNNETQTWVFTTPDDKNGNYSIYLYAGTNGQTNGACLQATNVILLKSGKFS